MFGFALGSLAVGFAEATADYRGWICAGDYNSPPCVQPPFWSWSHISPGWVVVGGLIGTILAWSMQGLARRERRRRRSWGEL